MSFNIALSGINAASTDLNVISNNIANANTVGFKDSRAEFGDLIQSSVFSVSNVAAGDGVVTQSVAQQFTQGTITSTGNPLDIAINGNGFFTLSTSPTSNAYIYTRNGAFQVDKNGYVVNDQGFNLQVYPAVPNTSPTIFSTGQLVPLQISTTPNPPKATTSLAAGVTLPVNAPIPANVATFDPTDPTSYNYTTTATVYDSLGAAHSASLYFSHDATTGPGDWTVYSVIDGDTTQETATTLQFDTSGNLITPAGGSVALNTFNTTDGSNPLNINLDLTKTIQYGSTFQVNSLAQDGYTTGDLSGVQISQTGVVTATYTNGQNVPLGQMAMTTFANQQGLQQLGNSTWAETFDSGSPLRQTAASSNVGTLQAGALESSNTDLTTQLVNMMTAQRNYQANSQVISTEDQLLQTILQLR
jgi:flagellar hook protein FlgE